MSLRSKPLDGMDGQKVGRLLKQRADGAWTAAALDERMLSLIRSKTAQPFWSAATKKKNVGGEDEGYFGGLGRKSRIQRLKPDILRC